MTEVTVVIPTKDRREFAVRAVNSALAQHDVQLEIIVVDDGSRDGTAAYVDQLGDAVSVLSHATSHGVARSRNDGLQAATGDWVAFLDDDDVWSPEKLARQIAHEPDADWVYSGALVLHASDGLAWEIDPPPASVVSETLLHNNTVPGGCSNVVARRELLLETRGFDEQLSVLADWDLWLRLSRQGRPAAVSDHDVGYLVHAGNMHKQSHKILRREIAYMERQHPWFAERRDPIPFTDWSAHVRFSEGQFLRGLGVIGREWLDRPGDRRFPQLLVSKAKAEARERIHNDVLKRPPHVPQTSAPPTWARYSHESTPA